MKVKTVDGVVFDKAYVTNLRENLIVLRDSALTAGLMDWAFNLSMTIAFLAGVIEELEA